MTNPFKMNLGRLALLILSGLMLASCVVEDVPPRPGPPRPMPPSGPVMCTREYAPVCARRGGDLRTFGNSCMARADGYRVVDRGPCRAVTPIRPPRPRPQPAPAMCPMIYAPVCAGRGGVARTFGNECQARAEGFRVLRNGRC